MLNLTENGINEIHREGTTKLTYRLAWARNYLKRFGLIENSSRGVWTLTKEGYNTSEIDQENLKRAVAKKDREERFKKNATLTNNSELQETAEEIEEFSWQNKLIGTIKKIHPDQFERLCQRLLRELGFVNVVVTGKTNDGVMMVKE